MWTFAGFCLVAVVLQYWLRQMYWLLRRNGAVLEAGLNRAAENRGERPISEDVRTRVPE